MAKKNTGSLFYLIFELVYVAFTIFWLWAPAYIIGNAHVQTYLLPFALASKDDPVLFNLININIYLLIYIVPLISLFKIVSIFFRRKFKYLCLSEMFIPVLLNIISSSLIIASFVVYILNFSTNIQFFYAQPVYFFIIIPLTAVFNVAYSYLIVRKMIADKTYREYSLSQANEKSSMIKRINHFFNSIQKKLLLSFLTIIIIIISVLSLVLLRDYKQTILHAVEYSGKTIAQQSASFFKENFSDDINIKSYLHNEGTKNAKEELKYESLSIYKKQGKDDIFIAEFSTNEKEVGKKFNDKETAEYSKIQIAETFNDQINHVYSFISPIKLQDKIIGFSVVKYKEDVIYESYFKTQIRVIMFTLLFIYISFLLIYIIGFRIVSPLLYLRMNVKKLSIVFSKMLSGEEKVSAGLLKYEDTIKSKDEIKGLSTEIGNMTTLIKGMIPYVSISTFQQATKNEITSEKKDLAFMFTDIRGFTTMCEGYSPDDVVKMLNHYLNIQATIISKYNGDIDKFVGDEVMAVFDGPDKELNACRASMELRSVMQKEKEEREKKNLTAISIGIGINTGTVIFGSVGARDRMDFTSIGDTVNLAARLEGANKQYSSKSLITEAVFKKIESEYLCREIDLLTVKGKTEPVRIYEILEEKTKATKKMLTIKQLFEDGLKNYRKMKWDTALTFFNKNVEEYNDEPSLVFINRIQMFKMTPPPEKWDGVFNMKVK